MGTSREWERGRESKEEGEKWGETERLTDLSMALIG